MKLNSQTPPILKVKDEISPEIQELFDNARPIEELDLEALAKEWGDDQDK